MNRRAALLVVALLAASCSGPGTVESVFGEGSTFVNIQIEVPPGWHAVSVFGRIILAEHAAELNSRSATGARLTVESGNLDPAGAAMTMLPSGSGDSGTLRIVAEPQETSVAGIPAVELTVEDASGPASFVRRYLVIFYAGTASLIVAEGPADRWNQVGPMLDNLLQQSLEVRP